MFCAQPENSIEKDSDRGRTITNLDHSANVTEPPLDLKKNVAEAPLDLNKQTRAGPS